MQTITRQPGNPCLLLFIATAATAAIVVVFGMLCYPGMHNDGDMFLPAIINVGAGKGWLVQGYTPLLMAREGSELCNNHGFLMPLLFGSMLHASSMKSIYFLCGVINALSACLYTWLAAAKSHSLPRHRALFAWMLGVTAGVLGIYLQGRPEQLALLIIPIPVIVFRFQNERFFHASSIGTMASLGALSPLLGLYYWIGHSVFLVKLCKRGIVEVLKWQLITIMGSLLIFTLAISAFTPFNTLTLAKQIIKQSKTPYVQGLKLITIGDSILQASLWQIPVLVIIGSGIWTLCKSRQLPMMVAIAALAIILAKLSGNYPCIPFVPICYLLINDRTDRLIWRRKVVTQAANLLFMSLYVLIFARYCALETLYLKSPTRYEAVKATTKQLQAEAERLKGTIGYSKARFPTFAVFGDSGRELIAIRAKLDEQANDDRLFYERSRNKQIKFIIIVQEGHMGATPPAFIEDGTFELMDNHWTTQKARLWGLKLGGYAPGYNYAMYRRTQAQPS